MCGVYCYINEPYFGLSCSPYTEDIETTSLDIRLSRKTLRLFLTFYGIIFSLSAFLFVISILLLKQDQHQIICKFIYSSQSQLALFQQNQFLLPLQTTQQSMSVQQNKIEQHQPSYHVQQQSKQNPQLHQNNLRKQDLDMQQSGVIKMEQKFWEAQLIDGKFYLTDPQSLEKLRKIQQQIEYQRKKLETLEHQGVDTIQHSFYSLQQDEDKAKSEKSHGAITDINQSLLVKKMKNAEKDLHEEEQNYRAKIVKMQRKRSQIKKQMLPCVQQSNKQHTPSESIFKNKQGQKQQEINYSTSKKVPSAKKSDIKVENTQKRESKNSQKAFESSVKLQNQRISQRSNQRSIKQKSQKSQKNSKQISDKKGGQYQSSKKSSAVISEHHDISKQISQKLNLEQLAKNSKKNQSADFSSNLSEARKKYNIAIHQYKENSKDQIYAQNQQLNELSKKMGEIDNSVKQAVLKSQKKIVQTSEKQSASQNKNSQKEHSSKNQMSQKKSKRSQKKFSQKLIQQQLHSMKQDIKKSNQLQKNEVNSSYFQSKASILQKKSERSIQPSLRSQGQASIKLRNNIKSSKKSNQGSVSNKKQLSGKKHDQKEQFSQGQSYLSANKLQQHQTQKSLIGAKSNTNQNKQLLSEKNSGHQSIKNQISIEKNESIVQPSQKSQKSVEISAKIIVQAQIEKSQKQKSIKSQSKFSEREDKSMKLIFRAENQEELHNKTQRFQVEYSRQNDKSSLSQCISKKSSKNSERNPQVNNIEHQQCIDQKNHTFNNKKIILPNENPILIQKQSEQSVISSIHPHHLQDLQSKKGILFDNKSVQWSQRPEYMVSQQPNFGKTKKVYQASQDSRKSDKIVEQKEQTIQQLSTVKKSIQIQNQKSMKQSSAADVKDRKKINLNVDFIRKTKKQDIKCNRSEVHEQRQFSKQEKRNKSFIIHHQKHESVKSGNAKSSKKSSQKQNSSVKKSFHLDVNKKIRQENKSKQESFLKFLGSEQKDSKSQIQALNKQVVILQNQLKKVQQRQIKIQQNYKEQKNVEQQEKMNFNKAESQIKIQSVSSEHVMSPLFTNKIRNFNGIQNRLNLASSITHFNSVQENEKKRIQDFEKNEKQRLKEQISNLKKIIRDMQMDKIKSIDNDTINSGKNQKFQRAETFIQHKADDSQVLDKWKQSLNSNQIGTTQQLQWNSDIFKNIKGSQMLGKIVKNSPKRSNIEMSPHQKPYKMRQYGSLQRKQSQRSQPAVFYGTNIDSDFKAVTMKKFQSSNPSPRKNINPQLVRQQILERLQANQKNFKKFMQCSKLINDGDSNPEYLPGLSRKSQHALQHDQIEQMEQIKISNLRHQSFRQNPSMIDKKSKLSTLFHKFDSQQVQKFEQMPPPQELEFSNWEFPKLPETPNQYMQQEDLLHKAKQTYQIFGIKIQNHQQDLCLKKYKNCVMFTFAPSSDIILWHFSGKFYIGGWKINDPGEGQKNGEGIQYIPEKYVFKGQFLNGKKNGNGLIKTSCGNIYEGQFVDGVKNGRGKYFEASTNATYNGQWKQGKKQGFGVLKFSQKQYYQGTFVKSIKHGYGTEKFINGDYYKGQYSNGKFCGKGKYVWSNSSCFQGEFVDGCRHGQGTWRSSSINGDVYIGEYVNDKKCGYGRYVWTNGCAFEGYFKNDVKHGKGRLSYSDGKQIKGTWENGILATTDQNRRQFEQQDQPLRKSLKFSTMSRLNGY